MIVNNYWIHHILTGVSSTWHAGRKSPEADFLYKLNMDDEVDVKIVINNFIAPVFDKLPRGAREKVLESLRYTLLTKDDDSLSREFFESNPLIKPPHDLSAFFNTIFLSISGDVSVESPYLIESYIDLDNPADLYN